MKVILKNVFKSFGTHEVIKDLNLEIEDGELIAIVGPSGCGKSTTLYMLSGLEDVTSGNVFFGDKDVTKLSADKRDIGLVFQNYALYPHYTVFKNIMFPLTNRKNMSNEERIKATEDIIEAVGLTDHAKKVPGQLSGGQAQRVAIARAIVKQPHLLLLDEPLSNLDAKLKMSTILEIKKIQRQFGITTVFVTHDQQEALAISDRMVVLHDGNVKQIGKPNELYRNPANRFVAEFIGSPVINTFEADIKNGLIVGLDKLVDKKINVEDGRYVIGIRPEALDKSETGHQFDITEEEILGRDVLYYCKSANYKLRVLISNTADSYFEKLDSINLCASINDLHLFDVHSGDVISFEK